MLGKNYEGQECALASALEVLGERWTLLIVRDAMFGVRRYSDWVARLDIRARCSPTACAGLSPTASSSSTRIPSAPGARCTS